MKILVVGSGGREHAIAKKFSESPLVERVFVAPGNAGMKRDKLEVVNISELNISELIKFAKDNEIAFTFVGPETALMNGIVDAFEVENLKIFGPRQKAAMIEGSKDFAKKIMTKYGVPTADYATFENLDAALAYVQEKGAPIVIKADDLAAGKGVTVALDEETAVDALRAVFETAEAKVVIEECLVGEEFSLFCLVHEGRVYPMPIAQDHKRAFDGDLGPNTGGMGAYAPVPQIPESVVIEALEKVVKPVVAGLQRENCSFTGVLYAGLMLTKEGVKTIEFNARFGDPETQVVLERMTSDFALAIDDILAEREPVITWCEDGGVTLGVVVASDGYPAGSTKGLPLPETGMTTYYAGVAEKDGQLVSNGGRVYMVTESGGNVSAAQQTLYEKLDKLDNTGMFYRHDIGGKRV
ncbi:MAG: phosphoribosylamine--glycine ligase [Streptococcaceae bacterium]|jgi:phosphoribosylamine--glycine ligase|nr:phosphoribosylamine--glycine ligase [Streptococcaceae bacterium]